MNFLCAVLLLMTTFTFAMNGNPSEHGGGYEPITFTRFNSKNALQQGAKQDRTLNMVNDIMTRYSEQIESTLRFCSQPNQHGWIQNRVIYPQTTKTYLLRIFGEYFVMNFENYLSFTKQNIAAFYHTKKEGKLEIHVMKICELTRKAMCLQAIIHVIFRNVYKGMFRDLRLFYNLKDILCNYTDNCKRNYSVIIKDRKISEEQYNSLLKKLDTYAKNINDLVEFLEKRKESLIKFMDADKNDECVNLLAFVQQETGRMAETGRYVKQIGGSNPSVNDNLPIEDRKFNLFSARLDVTAVKDSESEIKDRNAINETATDQIVSSDDVKPALSEEINCNTMQPNDMQDCAPEGRGNESDDNRSYDTREEVTLGQTVEGESLNYTGDYQYHGTSKQPSDLIEGNGTDEIDSGCMEDSLAPYEEGERFFSFNSLTDASDQAPVSLEDASNNVGLTHTKQKHRTPIQQKHVNDNITHPGVAPNDFGCNPHIGPGHHAISQSICWNNPKLAQPDIVPNHIIQPYHPCLYQAFPPNMSYPPPPYNNYPYHTQHNFPLLQYHTSPPSVYENAQQPQFNPGALNKTRPPFNTRKHAPTRNIQGQTSTQHEHVISPNINPGGVRNHFIPTRIERKLVQGHSSHSGVGDDASGSRIKMNWNQPADKSDESMSNQDAPTLSNEIWRPTENEKKMLEERCNYLII